MYIRSLSTIDAISSLQSTLEAALYDATITVDPMRFDTKPQETKITLRSLEVVRAYCENHRDYHDVRHPAGMLEMLWQLQLQYHLGDGGVINVLLARLLICYHDVVIKIGQPHGWNEEQSALLAEQHLRELGASELLVRLVGYGIRCSATHSIVNPPADFDEMNLNTIALFLDIDLAGLGQEAALFAKDTERVWHEFRAHITREKYDAGRAKWAEHFLERPNIYHTEYFEDLEKQARTNLAALARAAA